MDFESIISLSTSFYGGRKWHLSFSSLATKSDNTNKMDNIAEVFFFFFYCQENTYEF
jgi:hypothetical protein